MPTAGQDPSTGATTEFNIRLLDGGSRRHSRIANYIILTVALWGYYSCVNRWVGRPSNAQTKSPASVANEMCGQVSASWSEVSITAGDGAILRAWLFRPANPNRHGVILTHQMGGTRLNMIPYASWLAQRGFTCLLPDSRAHGSSGGSSITFGILEKDDIARWVELLHRQEPYLQHVSGLGISLGASLLVQAAAAGTPLRAVVADSIGADPSAPYRYFADLVSVREGMATLLFSVYVEPVMWNARIRHGLRLREVSLENAIRNVRCPVLLIHGRADDFIPIAHARRLQRTNHEFVRLWEVSRAGHARCFDVARDYPERVIKFLLSAAGPE